MPRLEYRVANVDCENEAAAIERAFRDRPGVLRVEVAAKSARVMFDVSADVPPRDLEARLAELGYPVVRGEPPRLPPPWRNARVVASVVSGAMLLVGWALPAGWPATVAWLVAMAIGGWAFAREGVAELIHEREVRIELLMTIAAVAAAALGLVGEGAVLVFLYSISEALEGYTEEQTRSAVRALMSLAPKLARVRRDGAEVEVPAEDLSVGDVFVVRPGERVPTDGKVSSGRSSVDQAPVTGESVPVEKVAGDDVFAGSINGAGALEVQVSRPYRENAIARIVAMVEDAQERKGRGEQLVARFGRRYSPAVLLASTVVAVVPPLVGLGPWMTWLERATILLVAAAPCALVISVPVASVAALGTAARHGVLIKGGIHLEALARVRVIALDKTGTLTEGRPRVVEALAVDGDVPRLLGLAAAVEGSSEHPLARAVVARAEEDDVPTPPATDFRASVGESAAATIAGRRITVGRPDLFDLGALSERVALWRAEGRTVVGVGEGRQALGILALQDAARDGARRAIGDLHAAGLTEVVMLTGDHEAAARAIGEAVGVDDVRAGLVPEEKVRAVRELEARNPVLMVGDGVNDAPALAEATVGVAMGAAGTDVALETADVALMGDDLGGVAWAIRHGRRHAAIVRQNLVLSALVVIGLVVGTLLGFLSLPAVVVAHELSELLVIANGLRMLRATS